MPEVAIIVKIKTNDGSPQGAATLAEDVEDDLIEMGHDVISARAWARGEQQPTPLQQETESLNDLARAFGGGPIDLGGLGDPPNTEQQ